MGFARFLDIKSIGAIDILMHVYHLTCVRVSLSIELKREFLGWLQGMYIFSLNSVRILSEMICFCFCQ